MEMTEKQKTRFIVLMKLERAGELPFALEPEILALRDLYHTTHGVFYAMCHLPQRRVIRVR